MLTHPLAVSLCCALLSRAPADRLFSARLEIILISVTNPSVHCLSRSRSMHSDSGNLLTQPAALSLPANKPFIDANPSDFFQNVSCRQIRATDVPSPLKVSDTQGIF